MAIVTDQTITVHGVQVGISKPIQTLIANGDFTFDELSKFAIVGRFDFVNDKAGVYEPDSYSYMAGTSAAISELEKYPVLNSPTAPGWDSVLYEYFGSGNRSYDNYGKMVLVYNMVSSDNTIGVNFNDGNTACIVTEFNPRLIKMMGSIYTGNVVADVGDTGSYTIYDPEASTNFVWYDDDTSAPFRCLCIQNFGDAVYFDFPLYNNIFNTKQNISGNRDSTYVSLDYIFDDYASTGNKLLSVWCDGGIDDFLVGANYGTSFVGVHVMSDDRGDKILVVRYVPYGAENSVKASSLDTALKQLAGCGFYFEANGTVYKPVTEGGIVTGYTADLSKNGEWDLINDVTGNSIPDAPGGGGGGEGDDEVDMPLSASPFGSGLTHFYVTTTTSQVLETISEALSAWNIQNTGKDLFRNLISCKLFGHVGGIPAENSTFVIYGEELTDSQGDPIQISKITDNPTLDLGSVKIDRFFKDFRDYAPYTKVEMFIPYCGWVPLPSHVVGNTVSATLIVDIIAGTCKAVIKCGRTVVAEAAGVCALDVPFVAENAGMKMAAIANSITSYGKTAAGAVGSVVSGASSGAAGAGAGAAGALVGIIGGYAQMEMSANANYTEICGKTADGCNIGGLGAVYIKVSRPNYKKLGFSAPLYVPEGFGHSVGFLAMKTMQIKDCAADNYIQCANVDTSGISGATKREREEIKRLLESGIIV